MTDTRAKAKEYAENHFPGDPLDHIDTFLAAYDQGFGAGVLAALNLIESRGIHMGDNPVMIHPEPLRADIRALLADKPEGKT